MNDDDDSVNITFTNSIRDFSQWNEAAFPNQLRANITRFASSVKSGTV